ncbi:MAG: DNA-binding protein [Prevotella sp.]|jgi:predicted histone-like DNA-binding protein|nr:DNA-binding protein [Prevotella sp.]MCH4099266.1 DNA-binding protein [Prevotella sp.]MCI1472935.1 DNA-binding protein [Prevotella sp.]MCI1519145.1 DNA-binding protein [Prevotella sp.]MCI1548697.1 DNA-binding protein [Prevotella sp.]
MSVKYKLSQIVDHSHPSRNGKWFARVCVSGVVHTPELADMITRRCTATEADTLAVLSALKNVMKEQLMDGQKVVLDSFGYFHTGIKSVALSPSVEFKPKEHIKRVYTHFVPAGYYDSATHRVHRSFNDGIRLEEMEDYSRPKRMSGADAEKS